MSSSSFTFGVNYWPRKKAMAMWKRFDLDEIRQDFQIIKDIGMSLVRIFVLWQDFQPTSPESVDPTALSNLKLVADVANDLNLKLDVTVPTVHMSGPNWVPAWLIDSERSPTSALRCEGSNVHRLQVAVNNNNNNSKDDDRCSVVSLLDPKDAPYFNPLFDEVAIQAQLLLLENVVTTLADSPSVELWNLGNEIDLASFARSKDEGVKWATLMTNQIRKYDQKLKRKITCGLHTDSLRFSSNNFPVEGIFGNSKNRDGVVDVRVMHAYPQYQSWLKDPLNTNFVAFSCILTSILTSKRTGSYSPVLMEEFGGCTAHPGAPSQHWTWKTKSLGGIEQNRSQFLASESDFAQYIETVLTKLHFCGASGALVWCFADYHCDVWRAPPCDESYHERFFGLVRPDGSLKPHALVVKEFSKKNLSVKNIDQSSSNEDERILYQMYDEILESLKKNTKFESGDEVDWVKANADDESGNNEAALEKVFRDFEKNILPKYFPGK